MRYVGILDSLLQAKMGLQHEKFAPMHRLPGHQDSPGSFTKNMHSSADVQTPVPLDRWDADALLSVGPEANKIYSRFSATLSSVAEFDSNLFSMSKAEASSTDPQVTPF